MLQQFVFISHARDDKLRIVPILRDLQEKHGILCWIDRPDDVSKVYPGFQTFGKIKVREAWPDAVHNALEACSCALVFWSVHANAARKGVVEEAQKALLDGKLVQVELDPGAMDRCDSIFQIPQAIRFHVSPWDKAIQTIADTVKEQFLLVEERRGEDRRMQCPALIPYIINRHPQINDLRADLCLFYKQANPASAYLKPVYISRGLSNDCPERFFERFEEIDGPAICKHFKKSYGRQTDRIATAWPTDDQARPIDVRRHVTKTVDAYSSFLSGPCLALSVVGKLRGNEADYVAEWFTAWNNEFTKDPSLHFIPVLDLRLDGVDRRWNFGRKGVLDRIFNVVADWSKNAEDGKCRIVPVKLDRLQSVSRDDASGWAWRHFGQDVSRKLADELVLKMFREATTSLPMAEFAEGVRSEPWFQELLK